nr:MAG TPA: hypothetical protein [Caudoviricetes sp.]
MGVLLPRFQSLRVDCVTPVAFATLYALTPYFCSNCSKISYIFCPPFTNMGDTMKNR